MATSRKRMLLIGGLPGQLRKAASFDAEIVYCQFIDKFEPEQAALVDAAILADYTDWKTFRPLVEAAHEVWDFDAVVSLTEPGLDPAGRVNDLLGLPGTSYEVSHRFANKWAMRQWLAEHSPPGLPVVAAAVVTGRDSLAEFGAAHGYPFIVKPTGGTASVGVLRVPSASALDSVWSRIGELRADTSHPLVHAYDLTEFVMEEYVEGDFHTVETFSFGGRHVVLTITQTTTLDSMFVHDGHAIPAKLAPEVEAALVDATVRFLDALELRDGPAHTEFVLTAKGPVVIESQNRVGGALFGAMMEAVYGVDPQKMAIGWPLGLVAELPDRPAATGAAASLLVLAEPGRVLEVLGLDEVRADPDTLDVNVAIGPGDVVRQFDASWDGLGYVAMLAEDADTAAQRCRESVAKIKIQTEPQA